MCYFSFSFLFDYVSFYKIERFINRLTIIAINVFFFKRTFNFTAHVRMHKQSRNGEKDKEGSCDVDGDHDNDNKNNNKITEKYKMEFLVLYLICNMYNAQTVQY